MLFAEAWPRTWLRKDALFSRSFRQVDGDLAFMSCMKPHELEAGACAQLVADHSDSDPEDRV